MDIQSINKRIANLCQQRNWSYYRLAKEAGFQQSTLKPIIKEKNMPSLYTLAKICRALGITIAEFFSDDLFQSPTNPEKTFSSLWNELKSRDKEKVIIYMSGLLHKEIKKEDIKYDL